MMAPFPVNSLISARTAGLYLLRHRVHGNLEGLLGVRFASSLEPVEASAETDVTPDVFLKKIGKGCEGLTDKFPGGLEEILGSGGRKLKKMGVPVKQRKLIMRHTEQFKQGVWHPIPGALRKRQTPAPPAVSSTGSVTSAGPTAEATVEQRES